MKTLDKIDVLSVLKITALIGLCFGILLGFFNYVISIVSYNSAPELYQGITIDQVNDLVGPQSIFLAIFVWIAFVIASVLFSLLYNLLSKWVGGIKFKLEEKDHAKKD